MIPKKLIRLTQPLAKALAKGAHRKEVSQQRFMLDALENALLDIGDEDITQLVSAHQVEMEEKARTNNQEELTDAN